MENDLEIDIPVKLHCLFDEKLDTRYITLYGGRGSGKSWTIASYLVSRAFQRTTRILCTREIQRTIKDSVYRLLTDKIDKMGLTPFFDVKHDTIVGDNGSEFIFKGLSRNIEEIKSMEGIDICWSEEAQSISQSSLDILIPTIRKENSQILFTLNPTLEDDPVYKEFILKDRPDNLKIQINYDENKYFPEVLRKEMEYDRKNDPGKHAHVWLGQCIIHSEAQVFYGKWSIYDFEKEAEFYYFGADWGFSQDPSALVRCFVDGRNLFIDYETGGIGIDIDKLPEVFNTIQLSDKYPITADSARPETISYMKKNGFPLMKKSIKGKGSIEDGVAFLRSFEKIIIHPRCKNTINEFRLYKYKVDAKTDQVSNVIEDKNNHYIDALRYAVEDLMKSRKITATKSLYR